MFAKIFIMQYMQNELEKAKLYIETHALQETLQMLAHDILTARPDNTMEFINQWAKSKMSDINNNNNIDDNSSAVDTNHSFSTPTKMNTSSSSSLSSPVSSPLVYKTGRTGIGATFVDTPKGVAVLSIIHGSPAETSGVQIGDIIQNIDGLEISSGATAEEISKLVAGTVGSAINLTLQRNAKTVQILDVKRGIFVSLSMLREAVKQIPRDQQPINLLQCVDTLSEQIRVLAHEVESLKLKNHQLSPPQQSSSASLSLSEKTNNSNSNKQQQQEKEYASNNTSVIMASLETIKQQNVESKEYHDALHILLNLSQTKGFIADIVKAGGILSLASIMKSLRSHSETQEFGCSILSKVTQSADHCKLFVDIGGLHVIAEALKNFSSNLPLIEAAMGVLFNISRYENLLDFAGRKVAIDALNEISIVLSEKCSIDTEKYPYSKTYSWLCGALGNLCSTSTDYGVKKSGETIVSILRKWVQQSHVIVTEQAVWALRKMTNINTFDHFPSHLEEETLQLVCTAMASFAKNSKIQECGVCVLLNLVANGSLAQQNKEIATTTMQQALSRFPSNAVISSALSSLHAQKSGSISRTMTSPI